MGVKVLSRSIREGQSLVSSAEVSRLSALLLESVIGAGDWWSS